MQQLSAERVHEALAGLDAGAFGANLHYYPRIGSTNDVARELAAQGAPEGTLVLADEQTAGRGRMARRWIAPPGSSLLLSILFRPALHPAAAYRLVMISGLATAEACEALAGVRVDIKWPNDLQTRGKKLGGILPESAIQGERLLWVVVGLGLNVSQEFAPPDPLAQSAISLRMAAAAPPDRAALLAGILTRLNAWYAQLGSDALVDAWRARCSTLGQRIVARTPGGIFTGWAEEIDANGALWLRTDDGQRHLLAAGEATIRGEDAAYEG